MGAEFGTRPFLPLTPPLCALSARLRDNYNYIYSCI